MEAREIKFLRKIENNIIMVRMKNETHRKKLKVKAIEDKIEEEEVRWFEPVKRTTNGGITKIM